jgi:hypothetical protein
MVKSAMKINCIICNAEFKMSNNSDNDETIIDRLLADHIAMDHCYENPEFQIHWIAQYIVKLQKRVIALEEKTPEGIIEQMVKRYGLDKK